MSLARHTVYNLAGQLVPLALSLLTTPVYLHLIGEARFGVLALLWVFFGYLGLFDLGMGQATARLLSQAGGAEPVVRAGVFRTALLLSLGLGITGALVATAMGRFFLGDRLAIDAALQAELQAALPWALVVMPTAALAGVLNGALQARSAFADINAVGVAGNALSMLAPLALAAGGAIHLPGLVGAVAGARLLALGLLWWRARGHDGGTHAGPLIDGAAARRLLRFGSWATVSAVVSPLLVTLDRFLIGARLGTQAVSHYVIPFQLAERATALSSALGSALFPRLSASPTEAERHALALRSLRVLALWTTPLIAAGMLLAGPFLAWWISPELASRSTLVAQILCLAFWVNGLAMVPYTRLLASGRPDAVAQCHLAELLPYLALLYAALRWWGLAGAAAAFAARVGVDFLLLAYRAGMLAPTCALLALPALMLAATLAALSQAAWSPVWHWGAGLAALAAMAAWSLTQRRHLRPA